MRLNAAFINHLNDLAFDIRTQPLEELLKENRLTEMLREIDGFLQTTPHNVPLLNLKGIALYQSGLPVEALRTIAQVKKQIQNHPTVLSNFSYILLSLGLFKEGWAHYETRLQNPDQNFVIKNARLWDGTPTENLLLLPEQGFGDMIQFLRFVPFLKPFAQKLILACPDELLSLVNEAFEPQGFEGFHRVAGSSREPQAFKADTPYIPLCSLPHHLNINLMNLHPSLPYLYAPPEKIETWRGPVESYCTRSPLSEKQPLRVGLAWSGRPTHGNNHNRSLDGALLAPLASVPNVAWVSLQKEKTSSLPSSFPILDLMDQCEDLVDTLSLIHHLDLVITVDTSVAHMAGAMGKPTWLMLPFAAEWRWMQKGLFTPWYPTMVLFRQEAPGDWASVFRKILQQFSYLVPRDLSGDLQPPPESPVGDHCFYLGKKALLQGDAVLAEKLLCRAIGTNPSLAGAHNILGIAYAYQKKTRAAIQQFSTASRLLPNYGSALMNFGMAAMKMDLPEVGLPFYECRISANPSHYVPPHSKRWHKTSLEGKTLRVYGEQGFGDYIQFARFLPWIKPRAKAEKVEILVRPSLVRLFKTLKNIDEVIPWDGNTLSVLEKDAYIEYMSVPHHLGGFPTDLLVQEIPYFSLPSHWGDAYKECLHPHKLKVGLTWRVSPTGSIPEDRTLLLYTLRSLFYLKGIQWVSLQVDDPEEAQLMGLTSPTPPLQDFADTAALISQLDLVISADTAVAHLAASLDKPTWVMLSHSTPDWRWNPYSTSSRWYPKMKIFMQPSTRQWDSVVSDLYKELISLLKKRPSSEDAKLPI